MNKDTVDRRLEDLANHPATDVKQYKGYFVNGYYFDTNQGHRSKSSYNSGVCLRGNAYGDANQNDYYGVLEEIWELSYKHHKVVLFKCYWFDTRSMQVHPKIGMVQIKHKSRAYKEDPFILAQMAEQVCYIPYVSKSKDHKDWWVVVRIKARSRIDGSHTENIVVDDDTIDPDDIIQEDHQPVPVSVSPTDEIDHCFDDVDSCAELLEDYEEDEDEDENEDEDEPEDEDEEEDEEDEEDEEEVDE